jgi:phosphorylcholine metabolism protein LicD
MNNSESIFNEYKTINRKQCKENLFFLKKVFDKNKIFFRLGYGTLLGAIRENNFILGDNDIDLVFDKQDKVKVDKLIPFFVSNDFEVRRRFVNFISLSKKGNNVDFYFFSERNLIDRLLGRVTCSYGIWCVYLDTAYFDFSEERTFLGKKFNVFRNPENWLAHNYGCDWMIPKNKKGKAKTFFSSLLCPCYLWLKPRLNPGLVKKLVLGYRSRVR